MPVLSSQTVASKLASGGAGVRVGFDLVQISSLKKSVDTFGEAFKRRLFTAGELEYAGCAQPVLSERLAARFAAKEAVIKALGWSEAGINWRDIEVCKLADGNCNVRLHGHAAVLARAMAVDHLLVSLSHEGDYAGAFVLAVATNASQGALEVNSTIRHGENICGAC